jgi:hypothetical protein
MNSPLVFASCLVFTGLLLIVTAIRSHADGIAEPEDREPVRRASSPVLFHLFVLAQWISGLLLVAAGAALACLALS